VVRQTENRVENTSTTGDQETETANYRSTTEQVNYID